MNSVRKAGVFGLMAMLGLSSAGCDNKLLDPTQIGRFRPTPAVNVILDSLGVAEETPVAWENAEEPRPRDITAVRGDYTLRGGDLVRISIFELFQEGATMVNDYIVSETGKVSIPEVGVVQASGLTETQLEEEIKEILSPGILKEPSVTVTLMNSQQRTFSILGNGVPQPGRYGIPRYDFRLTDALATAGGPMQFNVSNIYVSRGRETADGGLPTEPTAPQMDELELIEPNASLSAAVPAPRVPQPMGAVVPVPKRDIPEPSEPAERYELEREMLDMIAPSAQSGQPASDKIATASAPLASERSISASMVPASFRLLVPAQAAPQRRPRADEIVVSPTELGGVGEVEPVRRPARPAGRIEWVSRNGKWIPISVGSGEETPAPPVETERAAAEAPREAAPDGGIEWVRRDGQWVPIGKGKPKPTVPPTVAAGPVATETAGVEAPRAAAPDGGIEWVRRNGQWVPIGKGKPKPTVPPAVAAPRPVTPPAQEAPLPMEAEWEEAVQTRLMKIPAEPLLAGDPRYNIVIKPGDTVYVPVDIIGEFCITGNVNRSGFVGITGRPMTLKMAIAAAGGLGPLAYPKHCEVIRRIGENREEIVMVDLDKIARGEQPDFFIKPNDLINVGTHPTSRWRAVLRNAFRAAYGFGFVYDRNFAYSENRYGTSFF